MTGMLTADFRIIAVPETYLHRLNLEGFQFMHTGLVQVAGQGKPCLGSLGKAQNH